jgi:mRNA interferase MazF
VIGGDVVTVPFPFTDSTHTKLRPALVVSGRFFNQHGYTLMAMVTSADGSHWPLDTPFDWETLGLSRKCFIRMKLFTIDNMLIIRNLGRLNEGDLASV